MSADPMTRFATGALFVLASGAAGAATVTVVNMNAAGVGFNDTTVVANTTQGCNIGETLGACRLRVFTTAANQWGRLLNSAVEIRVEAQMSPQTCQMTTAVLGSAGPINSFSNFTNAPRANTAYPVALANSLAGSDLSGLNDISTTFNVSIDTGTCLNGVVGWWYGIDPQVAVPANQTPLLPVVFHEIGHGLGFTSGVSTTTGGYFSGATPSIWAHFLYDTETARRWIDMTNAERLASATNDPDLVWGGRLVNLNASKFLGFPPALTILTPPAIAGTTVAQAASFGPSVQTNPVNATDVVLVNDNVAGAGNPAGTVNDGCETPFVNAAAVSGRIALIERGFCNFTVKAANAQAAGAVGVLVMNNTTGLPPMGGVDPTITIPALGISQALGNSIRSNLPSPGVNASMALAPGLGLSGTQNNCVRMFAPNPVQQGSSVSHFHSDATPDLLMEPSLNRTIFDRVDLTAFLFLDIGWRTATDVGFTQESFEDAACTIAIPGP